MNKNRIAHILLLLAAALFISSCTETDTGSDSAAPIEVQRSQPDALLAASAPINTQQATAYNPAQVAADFADIEPSVLDISERSYGGGNALAVTFSVPLDPSKNHDEYLQVSADKAGLLAGGWVLSESGKIAYFPHIDPKQSYTVQVYQGLPAGNGKKLSHSESKTVTTRDVQASFSFASQGSFLPMDLHSGLPVVAVNVPEVDVNFHRVKAGRLAAFLSQANDARYGSRYSMRFLEQETNLVHSARYQLDTPKNKRRDLNLPVQNIQALEQPGVYMAVMQKPGDYYENVQMTWFSVTDIGMHIRVYKDRYDVHLSSLKTAKPLKAVKLSWVNQDGAQISTAKSSPEGFASLPRINDRGGYLLAEQAGSVSLVPLSNAALDLSDFDLGGRPQLAHELFIYGPRDLYRPGETVQLSALLRNADGRLVKAVPLQSKIKRPDGQTAKEFSWQAQSQSYYDYEFELPQDAQTGEWQLQVKNIDGGMTSYAFKVEEFLPERMKLSFNPGQDPAVNTFTAQQTMTVNVLGEYLYGAPAAGNRLESAIRIRPQRNPIASLKAYQFGNVKEQQLKQNYTLKDTHLNNSGLAIVDIENRWEKLKSPVEVTLLASLFESGGRPVTRRHHNTVWPAPALIGIRPSFNDADPEANSRVSFDIVRANAQGEKLHADSLEVQLIREDRRYFWEYSNSQGWHYEYSDREYAELSSSVSIKAGETASVDATVEWGAYRLEVRDPEYGTLSSIRFYAGGNWYNNWQNNAQAGQAARPDKVSLALDKQHYAEGDTAVLSVVPPTAGEALVLVESDRPLFMQRISLPKQGAQLEIPLGKDWNRHDLYISVVQVQAAQQRNQTASITPKRSFGLIHLPLNREPRKLDVELHSADKILPNQRHVTKIAIKEFAKHRNVKLTLAAVDVGVLSITDYKTPDPHDYFFAPRRYQIDSRDMYQKLIELNQNALAKQRFGGDAELSRGGKKAQAEVQIVALFSGVVEVDADGLAEVPLDIPDFNGRLRLMVVAFSDDSFGSAEQEITVAAPLVTQLAMPRFLAMGDQSTFAVDIHNLTENPQELEVKLTATLPLQLQAKVQKLALKAGEKATLIYPVQAQHSLGRSQIHLDIQGMPNYPVSRDWGIQVRAAYPALTHTQQAWIKPGENFQLDTAALADILPESLAAVVKLNNSVDLNIRKQMDALLRYPYGCLEQSASSTYPWLFATDKNLQQMGLHNNTNKSRQQSIERGLQRIAQQQLSNGGYGLWTNKDHEEQWLTAYVGDFLNDARAMGVTVGEQQYNKTMQRLDDYVSKRNGSFAHPWNDDNGHYSIAYRAYAAYVLSRHQKANLSKLRSLLKQSAGRARSFLPLVHLGLALHNQGDSQLGDKALEQAFAIQRGDGYYADYGSDIRDSALTVHLLVRHKKHLDKARELGLAVAEQLQQRRYLSTQERNSLFLAGLALENGFAQQWQADLALKGAIQQLKYTGSFARKYDYTDLQQGINIVNRGEDDLWVNVDFQGYGTTPPIVQSSKNLSISRNYFNTKGEMIDPSQLTVGDLLLVRLQLGTAWRTPDAMVVDLLPAGLELENQNLNHAIKLDEIQFDKKPVAYWREQTKIVHQEFRDDRFVAAIDAGYQRSNYLFYLARAVTPGTYTVPAPFVEDMYRAEDRAVGATIDSITISNP